MGKDSPSPPQPIDPHVTASAQTESNAATARLQQQLGMINSTGPGGGVRWEADPTSPGGYRQVTELSAGQQGIYDAGQAAQQGALNTANDQIGRVNSALGQQLTAPQLQQSFNPGAQVQTGFSAGPGLQSRFNQGGQVASGFSNGGQVTSGFNNGGDLSRGFNTGAQVQTGFDTGGPARRSFDHGGQIQTGFDAGGQLNGSFNPGQNVQGVVGSNDFSQDREAATNGVIDQARSRLDPMWQQQEDKERTRLSNQGLSQNSSAYQTSMGNFGNAKNDAYNQAIFSGIQAGSDQQQRLFDQSVQQGQFANNAAGQQYNQSQGLAAFGNDVANQNFSRNAQQAQFGNTAAGQQFSQGLSAADFENQAGQQDYNRNLGAAQFSNQGAGQQYSQNMGAGQFANDATLADYNRNLGTAQFGNTAQAQRFGQNESQAQFGNQATAQRYGQNLGSAQFNNQTAGQQFGQNQAQAGFNNTAAAQQYGQNEGLANFGNAAAQQNFQNQAFVRQQPINDLSQLLGLGGQAAMPQGYNGSTPVNPTDVMGAYALYDQGRQNNYNQQMGIVNGQNQAIGNFAGALGSAAIMASDRRVKKDTKRLFERPDGVGIWAYRYNNEPDDAPIRFGVMADEVEAVMPHAVIDIDGVKHVDYGAL